MTVHGDVFAPVPMYLTNPEDLKSGPPAYRRKALRTRTLILTTDNPIQDLLPQSEARCEAWLIQCGDNDVIVCHTKSQASAPSNQVATPPNPSGALIVKGIAFPVPITTNDRTWVTAAAFPTRVSVVEVVYASD